MGLSTPSEGVYQSGGGGALIAVQGGTELKGVLLPVEGSEFLEWGVLVGTPGVNYTRYVMVQVYEAPDDGSDAADSPGSERTTSQ